ncbi:MAG: sugar phosphate nucleotidyltransferase [Defluviitaleaceae bacterium]|nr:sugar phosphate nucleotidyltransferase [Defluviitaleaceae bacterium]
MEKGKPILVILAAGMGSRFGGLKQIAPVDDEGHIIINYSLYDAYRAGFREVVCIINPQYEAEFEARFKNVPSDMNIRYAHQLLTDIPEGFEIPPDRVKPWGTAHALVCAKDMINAPFAVINADDFYGANAYKLLYDFLKNEAADTCHAMVAYRVENTLSENGTVSRGVCTEKDGMLVKIVERLAIKPAPGGAVFEDALPADTEEERFLPDGTPVSMNMWGFGQTLPHELASGFPVFLNENLGKNPLKCEFLLPMEVGKLLDKGRFTVKVLTSADKWYGVTNAEDMPGVRAAIKEMRQRGEYSW